jgi:hypothetical protein
MEIHRKDGIITAFGVGRFLLGLLRPFIASEQADDDQNGECPPRDESE